MALCSPHNNATSHRCQHNLRHYVDPAGIDRQDVAMASLDALLSAWLTTKPSPNTRAAYETDVRRYLAWRAAGDGDALADLERQLSVYRDHSQGSGASAATTARRLSAIVSFARFVARERGQRPLPPPQVKRPDVAATSATAELADEEARRLVEAAENVSDKAAALVRLLMFDGLRVGELLCAAADDAAGTPPAMSLRITRAGRSHSVVLHPDSATTLGRYLGARREGPLFLGAGDAGALTRFGVDYLVKRAGSLAKVQKNVSANTLRRRYVLVAQLAGADLDEIRHRLGHADRRTTMRYLAEGAE